MTAPAFLETVFERKLELAHCKSRLDDPKQRAIQVRAGYVPVWMVDDIESLKPELQRVLFSDSEILDSREVP
jgi:hypothetical protein